MKRNTQGKSLIESMVGTVLLGLTAAACMSIFLMFSRDLRNTSLDRKISETGLQIKSVLAPTLDGMVFRKYLPGTAEPNGPINLVFSSESTVSAKWYWDNGANGMLLLYPHIYGITQKSGICIQDRITSVVFDRANKSLSVEYIYTDEGELVGCLSGVLGKVVRTGRIKWTNVSEAQIINIGNRACRFWYKYENEWLSLEGGFLEE